MTGSVTVGDGKFTIEQIEPKKFKITNNTTSDYFLAPKDYMVYSKTFKNLRSFTIENQC